ncbi:hypothetical protein DL93DRAFT_2084162 [Clavulina sp. PMI_390]|nr:hypothetical protein DL93DRAFT_2084162 [Clavulina sp. PMI_390]
MSILHLATSNKPFARYERGFQALHAAIRGERPQRPSLEGFGGLNARSVDVLWELLTEMWDHDPGRRPPMRDVWRRLTDISTTL